MAKSTESTLSWTIDTVSVESDTQIDYIQNAVRKTQRTLVFTFANLDQAQSGGLGYGGKFLLEQGYDIITFKTSRNKNNWFQGVSAAAFEKIEQAIKDSGRKYQTRIGYGSSMGGFGALAFSRILKMDIVAAISPQIDISQDWDTRWGIYAKKIKFNYFINAEAIAEDCRYYIIADPYDMDFLHASRFAAMSPYGNVELIKLPYSGHPSGHFLYETGQLKSLMMSVFAGKPYDVSGTRKLRRSSTAYLSTLGDVCLAKHKPSWAIRLYTMAIALRPDSLPSARLEKRIAEIYYARKDMQNALTHGLKAIDMQPADQQCLLFAIDLLYELEDYQQALERLEIGIQQMVRPSHVLGLHKRKAKILEKMGDKAQAYAYLKSVVGTFDDPQMVLNLARMEFSNKSYADALERLKRVPAGGDEEKFWQLRLRVLCAMQDKQQATEGLKEYVSKFSAEDTEFIQVIQDKIAKMQKSPIQKLINAVTGKGKKKP
ncbi:hypothetical protein ED236_05200 [Pseudomethylobacillus aquaticus]|uniref:Uncharacterized protein n=1 Tax=Pseudomethylobacillus aquaticus TaxID=2676064 RepID=A0A3N0V2P1_9PROT|nr:hypothetical protein [Pseudomethylobacillus aquaticus]ROH87077.1 hypothetical protein ED236_05200 [Pseudomethylobacillus aquaticus]